jgi:hypothetical protein
MISFLKIGNISIKTKMFRFLGEIWTNKRPSRYVFRFFLCNDTCGGTAVQVAETAAVVV